jgi:hypothetical protein
MIDTTSWQPGEQLLLRWVAANAIASLVISLAAIPAFDTDLISQTVLSVVYFVVPGLLQSLALKRSIANFPGRSWVVRTAIGSFVGLVTGTLLVAIPAFAVPALKQSSTQPIGRLFLSISFGFLAGLVVGAIQWRVLHRFFPNLARRTWAFASGVALALTLGLSGGTSLLESGGLLGAVAFVLTGTAAGVAGALATGWVLYRLYNPLVAEQ